VNYEQYSVKELKLTLSNLGDVFNQLTKIAQSKNVPFRLSVKEWRESRSISQNNLFHKWVGELSKYLIAGGRKDSSPKFCKELFKHTFLGYEQVERVNAKTGERAVISSLKNTSDCDTGEMTHFMNKCYEWCVSIGLLLTIPEDSEFYKLMEYQNG
jgi:hypothetical protein